MYIFSLILSTIISVVNAGATIIAISGGFNTSLTSTSAGIIPRTVFPLIYALILPIILTFFILSFSTRPVEGTKKSAITLLKASLGLTLLQAIVSIVIYQFSYNTLISPQLSDLNMIPVIIEILTIVATFVGSIVCAIKAASKNSKVTIEPSAKILAIAAVSLGLMEFILDIIPVIIFRIDRSNNFTQTALQWSEYLRMLNPAIFAFAVINTIKKFDKFTVIAWLGVLLAFSARIALYLIAYI